MDFIFDDDVDEVGAEVEAFCPKCKADTAHVVMSKYEDEIRKVQCNPCGDVHTFRKPRGESEEDSAEPPVSKKRAPKAKPTWEQMMAKSKKEPKLYMVADRYSDNELISHPKFGVGFVSDVIGNDKIEITFQSERRVLVHNRKGMSLPPAAYAHPVDNTLPVSKRDRRRAAVKQALTKAAASRPRGPQKAGKAVVKDRSSARKPAIKIVKGKRAKPAAKAVASSRPQRAKAKARAAAPARSKPANRKRAMAGKKLKKR